MDEILSRRLNQLNEQNEALKQAEGEFRLKEAERKTTEAKLIILSNGKSHAEKTINAQGTSAWSQFARELAELETQFNFQRRRYDILDKAFLADYAGMKLDAQTLKRHGPIT